MPPASAHNPSELADPAATRPPPKPAAYTAFARLLVEAAIRIAATPTFAEKGATPPAAMFSTKGSMSVVPTIAASANKPPSPNWVRTQADASEITTNNPAKINAAVSSKGLIGRLAAACDRVGVALIQYRKPPSARPNADKASIAGARRPASGKLKIATI